MSESCGWVFVDNIPLIYEKRRVAKQLKVETWLYLTGLVKELGIENSVSRLNEQSQTSYIV